MTTHLVPPRARSVAAFLAVIVVLLATLMTPSALSAPNAGDSKLLDGNGSDVSNNPKPDGCTFNVSWSGYDPSEVIYYRFISQSGAHVLFGPTQKTLDGGGAGTAGPFGFNATNLSVVPLASQGYHMRFETASNLAFTSNVKSKVFYIEQACGSEVSLTKTSNKAQSILRNTEQVVFTMTATNTSIVATDALVIVDTLPSELTYVSATPAGSCSAVGQVVTCTIGVLAALTGSASVTVTATGNTVGGPWTNSATVYKTDLTAADASPTNNTATATASVHAPTTYSISGKKTEDTNRDNATTGDTDKTGWNIHLVADADGDGNLDAGETVTTQATGAGGTYSFTGLTAGADYLVCEDSGGAAWAQLGPTTGADCSAGVGYATNGHSVQNIGANQSNKDFWNKPPAAPTYSISGKKTEDTNRDNATTGDSDKTGWNIHLVADADGDGNVDAGETVTTQATGAGGTYSFTGLTAGNDYLVCEDSGGPTWTQLGPTTGADCSAGAGYAAKGYSVQNIGANQSNKDFWNQPPAVIVNTWTISGKKTEDTDRNGTTVGDNDKTGWNIHLVADADGDGNLDAGETVTTQATGAGGTYSFTGLTAGADYLVCEDSGGAAWAQLGPTTGADCSAGVGYASKGYSAQDIGANQNNKDFWNQPPALILPPPPVTLLPDLTVTKTGTPASIPVGGTVTFTLTVSNVGAAAATNVVLTDSLPAGLSFVSSTPGAPACSNVHNPLTGTDTMTCQLGSLAAGASTTVTVVATGTVAGTHVNTAVVDPTDATPSNNTDTEDTVVTPVADVSVTKTVDDSTVTVGDQVTYTLTVTNNGPSDATGVVVTDTLPAGLTFVSSDGACTGSSTITCTIGDLAAGATAVIRIVAEATEPGTFTNGVEVITTTPDPELGNNSDEVDVEVDEVLGIIVRPAQPDADPAPVVKGERQNVLPLTGAAILGLSGLGSALIMTGGLLLMFEQRRRKVLGT